MRYLFLLFFAISYFALQAAPRYNIKGNIINKTTREPIEYASVVLLETNLATMADSVGHFIFENVVPGSYHVKSSSVGLKDAISHEFMVTSRDVNITIEQENSSTELQAVTVTASSIRHDIASPIGMHIIGVREIEKSPGANRDISKIVQSYPGVSFSPAGYRNDLIVRGGSPSENRFYLDGVEIPNINHFSTEGASGGPVGIINADFIREVKFYTGEIPSNRGNALSSVLDFRLMDGNMDAYTFKGTVGASEVAVATTGHIGDKTSYLVSVRQSYLQLLFKMIGLPFLPTFTDGQFKVKTRFDKNNELTILGIAGIDDMKLNTSLTGESAEYILSYLPVIKQETFTLGATYRHYGGRNTQLYVLSHSYLNNRNTKYIDNDESIPENLRLKLKSIENETKFRFENNTSFDHWKLNVGANLEYARYRGDNFQRIFSNSGVSELIYNTDLNMFKWGAFANATYTMPSEILSVTLGLRTDANSYSHKMANPLKQLSPRITASYKVMQNLYLNGSAGLYYQLPAYTALGYRNNEGELINKNLDFMRVTQGSLGLSWNKGSTFQISLEGFIKKYGKMPLCVEDNIPLACKGDDYGVIGNELLVSTAAGRSYGAELLARWFIASKLNLSASFTLFKSEYQIDSNSSYIPSAWDNRYIINLTGTYDLPQNWSVGLKFKCIGGSPYTPYDIETSSLVSAWDAKGQPYYDYSLYNTERLPAYGQLDLRVDKTFYLGKFMLGFYIDLQNVTVSKFTRPDILMSTGIIENPTDPVNIQRYKMKYIEQRSGTLLPTLGVNFEF